MNESQGTPDLNHERPHAAVFRWLNALRGVNTDSVRFDEIKEEGGFVKLRGVSERDGTATLDAMKQGIETARGRFSVRKAFERSYFEAFIPSEEIAKIE